ncbi:MAG TPA: radical SAM family heme chaperone HemW [Acidimicrobiales bacterium]|nr:radical SAM family heme chaperone HemW [Acidimicrobiales bacterium]
MAFGVYVHVPFCAHRCDYCAFATWTGKEPLIGPYVDAVVSELRGAELPPATSVFFGGGTPSLLPGASLARILDHVGRAPGAEVTVECNPETVDAGLLAHYRRAGVTRLSFGVQSMLPHVLGALGRRHDPAAVRRAVALAGDAGYGEHYSVDLIMGAAGETAGDWRASLDAVLGLDPAPSHVSAYGLTVEPGTPLAADAARHPDPDDQADKYLCTDEVLGAAGLEWYEISNWARPGHECRHNQLYWAQQPYRGVGCAAHSMAPEPGGGIRRWWNVRTPERYIRAVQEGGAVEAAGERLDAATAAAEALQLALRTRDGVPVGALADDPLLDGLVERRDGRAVLTGRGRLLANEVALRLVPVDG